MFLWGKTRVISATHKAIKFFFRVGMLRAGSGGEGDWDGSNLHALEGVGGGGGIPGIYTLLALIASLEGVFCVPLGTLRASIFDCFSW